MRSSSHWDRGLGAQIRKISFAGNRSRQFGTPGKAVEVDALRRRPVLAPVGQPKHYRTIVNP